MSSYHDVAFGERENMLQISFTWYPAKISNIDENIIQVSSTKKYQNITVKC